MKDIVIIGAGVIGCNIARELSKYEASILVVEKNLDVCEETSKANSGISHSGYDAHPGTRKAKYNVWGNQLMPQLCKDLGVMYENNGSLIIGFNEEDDQMIHQLYHQGIENGVPELSILNKDELLAMEPNLNPDVHSALYAKTGGIVDPFQLTIASAEVANINGVEFLFDTKILDIVKNNNSYILKTNHGDIESKIVINAAGVYADVIHNMVCSDKIEIIAKKGEYCLLDKEVGDLVHSTIFQVPTKAGKGVLVTKTAEGNLLIGPTSVPVTDKEDNETTQEGIQFVISTAKKSVPNLPIRSVITGFAGLRASEKNGDFIIGESSSSGFFDVAGIESPGLTSAPAIALDLSNMIAKQYKLVSKTEFQTKRIPIKRFNDSSIEEKKKLIAMDHEYGHIVCRCEMVTLSEIKQAIHSPIGAKTVDGVKRRTRATSGRCQGGFCSPKIVDILSKELKKSPLEISKSSKDSTYLVGLDKELS